MKNMKYTLAAVAVFTMALLFNNQPYASKKTFTGGAACKAANLQQALSLGLGNNQFGTANNGNRPFFVVCPITFDGINPPTFLSLGVRFPEVGGNITCIGRFIPFNTDTIKFVAITIKSTFIIGVTNAPISGISGLSDFNGSIVCPLQPGQSIRWYGVQ